MKAMLAGKVGFTHDVGFRGSRFALGPPKGVWMIFYIFCADSIHIRHLLAATINRSAEVWTTHGRAADGLATLFFSREHQGNQKAPGLRVGASHVVTTAYGTMTESSAP